LTDSRPTLLVTRPAAQARRFAESFAARFGEDWPKLLAPMQQIVARSVQVPEARELVFTSENAVAAFAALSPAAGRRAWCVGARTAVAAARAGFAPVTGPGDGAALACAIIGAAPHPPLLVARGAHQAFDIAHVLNLAGIETFSACVYTQESLPLPAAAKALLAAHSPLLVPLFSPRSAQLFAQAAQRARAPLWVAALSPAVAESCADLHPARLRIAVSANAESMLDTLAKLVAG